MKRMRHNPLPESVLVVRAPRDIHSMGNSRCRHSASRPMKPLSLISPISYIHTPPTRTPQVSSSHNLRLVPDLLRQSPHVANERSCAGGFPGPRDMSDVECARGLMSTHENCVRRPRRMSINSAGAASYNGLRGMPHHAGFAALLSCRHRPSMV